MINLYGPFKCGLCEQRIKLAVYPFCFECMLYLEWIAKEDQRLANESKR